MTVYVVALSKGGSTKTTTAAELVAQLAAAGRKVVGVDLDQQGNLTTRLGLTDDDEVLAVAADVLTGEATLHEAAVPSPTVPGAWVVAGTDDLTQLDHKPEVLTSLALHLAESTAGEWDDVVIDTPPSLGIVTLAGLAAADVVVASVSCETEAYDQLGRLLEVLETRISKTRIKPGQTVHWVVPTKYDPRRLLDKEVVELLHERFGERVTLPVRESVKARDAYNAGMPVSVYEPTSPVAVSYTAALKPVLARSITDSTTLTTLTN